MTVLAVLGIIMIFAVALEDGHHVLGRNADNRITRNYWDPRG